MRIRPSDRRILIQTWPSHKALRRMGALHARGTMGPLCNRAIHAMAAMLTSVAPEIEEKFSPAEWRAMADAAGYEYEVDVDTPDPVGQIIAKLEVGHEIEGRGEAWFKAGNTDDQVRELIKKLEDLECAQAWGVAWTLLWRSMVRGVAPRARWWTMAHRQQLEPKDSA